MAQNRETRTVAHPALLAVGLDPDVMVWKQPVGVFRSLSDPTRRVSVGVPGQSDAMAVVRVKITADMVGKTIGVAVGPEFKTTKGKQREKQEDWQRCFESRGGVYRVIRSPEEMVQLVLDVKSGKAFK